MAQFNSNELRQALAELASGNGSEPLLRPEQVERITALNQESDPEVKGQKTMAIMDELVREAQAATGRAEQLMRDLGLDAADVSRFLGGEKLSDDARNEAAAARASFESELQQEIDDAVRAARPQQSRSAPRMQGRMRV